jgi:HAD superfamily hydrolase (TIGR01509 family)
MKALSEFAGIIFDLDGLVLDTEGSYFSAWKMAAEKMGYGLDDDFLASLSGLHYQAVEQALKDKCGQGFDIEAFSQLSGHCWDQLVTREGIAVKPGFQAFMALIQQNNLPFCLATNSHSDNAHQCLELAGLGGLFEIIVGREHVRSGKPAPDIVLHAARLMRLPADQCLVLEDSITGVAAAKQAGAYCVLIPSIPIEHPPEADQVISSLAELVLIFEAAKSGRG